jgi:hypothetical protein
MRAKRFAVLFVMAALVAFPTAAFGVGMTYLVGDKDDFNNFDGDGVYNIPAGATPALPYLTYTTPEAGNTDFRMVAKYQAADPFDFLFNVAAPAPGMVLSSAVVRVVTWDAMKGDPGFWASMPIKVKEGVVETTLGTTLNAGGVQREVQWDDIVLSGDAFNMVADGGAIHVIIGGVASTISDTVIVDYAELRLEFREEGGFAPVPEAGSGAILLTGLAGLFARRKRR